MAKIIREMSFDVAPRSDEEKNLYIEGIYIQAETQNGNGRFYPLPILEHAVEVFRNEKIARGNSWGELDHPETPTVNLKETSHRIVSLDRDGNNFVGKALIVDNFHGKEVKALLACGGVLGVSTRGLGTVIEQNGLNIIQSDFMLCTVDIVSDPSAPNAFVNGILEGKEWVCDNGVFRPHEIDEMRKTIKESKKPVNEKLIIHRFKRLVESL